MVREKDEQSRGEQSKVLTNSRVISYFLNRLDSRVTIHNCRDKTEQVLGLESIYNSGRDRDRDERHINMARK